MISRNFSNHAFSSNWRVTDVTQSVYTLLYRLTQRNIGVVDFARGDMLQWTLSMFERSERSPSLAHIVFPWLATPTSIIQSYASRRLKASIMEIINKRTETGNRADDALQYIYDLEGDADKVVKVSFTTISYSQAVQLIT